MKQQRCSKLGPRTKVKLTCKAHYCALEHLAHDLAQTILCTENPTQRYHDNAVRLHTPANNEMSPNQCHR